MNHSNLLKISNTNLVKLESKYHFRCLTTYKNKHLSIIKSNEKILRRSKSKQMLVDVYRYVERILDNER